MSFVAALRKQFLYVTLARCETEVEPNRVPDHEWRILMAGIRDEGHLQMLSCRPTLGRLFP